MSAFTLIAISRSSSQGHHWRLVRDERVEVLGVSDGPVQGAHPASAGPEGVHRAQTRRLADAVVVLGVRLRSELAAGRAGAPLHASWVVGDHRTVTEVAHQ